MNLNCTLPVAMVKLVCDDDGDGSPARDSLIEIVTGELDYRLVIISPLVGNGFRGVGTATALVASRATIAHHPGEIERRDPHHNHIPHYWSRRDG